MFQRLMLLEYQIGLDLASGMVLVDVCEWAIKWVFGRKRSICGHFKDDSMEIEHKVRFVNVSYYL